MKSSEGYIKHKEALKSALQKGFLKGFNALGEDAKKLEWFAGNKITALKKAA